MQTASPEDPRWLAVKDRDRAADGSFVYAVISTGIFCRPCCASRPARPESVRFYETIEAAHAGGFRACLRCRPERDPG
ncbi:MAG: Ada metal-binding domain-containing protein [Rhizobium sp.]|nr:Ada metal-binding domain-containing protein [Rhizobium sp.]